MFKNVSIQVKMYLQMALSIIAMLALAFTGFNEGRTLGDRVTTSVQAGKDANALMLNARSASANFHQAIQEWKDLLIRGNDPLLYNQYLANYKARIADSLKALGDAKASMKKVGMPTNKLDAVTAEINATEEQMLSALKTFNAADPETGKKVDLQVRGLDRPVSDHIDVMLQSINKASAARLDAVQTQGEDARQQATYAIALSIVLALVAALIALLVVRGLVGNVRGLTGVVHRLAAGDFNARADIDSRDELGRLGSQLNILLDDRFTQALNAQYENDQLNDSVMSIMTSVTQLAQRDLSVHVPVSEDVTGAVADAINMMTRSTAAALTDASVISRQVSDSSHRVKQRADTVYSLAGEASSQAGEASKELTEAAHALGMMGEQALSAGREAERALATTGDTLKIVGQTVEGIASSRDQIRETEKRVKRLAERSQEISATVTIIGQIAERTSVLALNASMQAVAAGDAGRGFAVVADEVKRLAENAREATQQIAGLVNAIQADTTETLQAMNNTITKVVEITHLADRAGTQMNDTRHATEALVNSVRLISLSTQAQASASQKLLERARGLLTASNRTLEEIGQQRTDTESLTDSASSLVRTISAFHLPT